MAYTVGEAAVQVTPYFDQFHNRIKAAVEKENKQHEVEVQVEAETRDFYAEMEAVEKRANALDGKRVNIYVDVDDSEATRKLNSFREISRDPITFATEVDGDSLQNSSRQINDFRDSHGNMDMFMRFNRGLADTEMDDFFRKYEERGLRITPKIDPRFMDDLARRSAGFPVESQTRRRKKDTVLESSYGDWDTLNHLPKFIEKMNLQVAIGLKQMGDAYFTTAEKMYRAMGKPYNRMKDMVNQADTLNDLFRRIARSPLGKMTSEIRGWAKHAYDFRKVIGEVFSRDLGRASRSVKSFTQRSLGSIGDKADELTRKMRRFLQHVPGGEMLVGLTAGAKEAAGKVGNFFRAWGEGLAEGWNGGIDRIKRTSTSLAGFIGNLTSRFSKFDVGFTDKLTGGLARAAGKAKELGTTISSTIPKGAEVVSNFFRNTIPDAIAEISPRLYHAFAHLKEIDFLGIQAGFQRVGDAARKVGKSISEGWNSWLDNSRIARHFRTIGDAANEQFVKMRGAFSRFRGFFSKDLREMGDTAKRRLGEIGGRFQRTFSRLSGPVARGMKRVGGVIGKGLSAAGRMIGNDSALYRGFKMIFGRVANMAIGVTRIMTGAFFRVGGVMMKSLLPAILAVTAGLALMGGQAMIGGILALGGAIGAVAAGALLMAPGLIAAAGISFAALKIGLEGVGKAVKSAFSAETPEEFEEAIADARPVVQELARSFRAFKPAIDEMKNAVQDNLLGGLSTGVTSMMNNLLPVFSSGLQGIATEWNGAIRLALDELSSTRAQTGLGAIMEGTRDMAREMQPVIANLLAAFGSLGEQASKFFGPFGKYLADASASFRDWAEGLKRINPATGLSAFDEKIEKMKKNAELLGDIFGGLFGTIGNVFAAGAEGGGGMLAGMAEAMQNLKNYTEEGSKGFNQIVGFMERATEASRSLGQAIGPIFDVIVAIGSTLAGVATGAIPGLATALEGLSGGLQPLTDSAEGFGALIGDALGAFAPVLEKLGSVLEPVLMGLAEGVNAIFVPLAGALDPVMDGLIVFAETARPVLETVGEAFGKIFESLGPVVGSFIDHVAAFLPVFGTLAGFLGETIAMIVDALAPIIDMMAPTMEKLAESLSGMFEQIFPALQQVIQAIAPILPIVAEAFFSILEAIMPLLPVLGEIVGTLLVALADLLVMLTPLLPPLASLIGTVARVLGEFLVDALEVVLDIWNAIWPVLLATFQFLFQIIIIPLITLVAKTFEILAEVIGFVWNNIIQPVLNLFLEVAKIVFNAIAAIITDIVIPILQNLGDFFVWIWNTLIQPVLDALKEKFTEVSDWIKDVIERHIKPNLESLKDKFESVVNGIKSIWEGLKKVFAAPIRFLLETVINEGVVKGWNWVDEKLDGKLGELSPVSVPASLSFATGGVLPGYTPGRDVHDFYSPTAGRLHLSGGEAIMRPEWTRAVGGPAAVEKMNRDAVRGNLKPGNYRVKGHAHHGGSHFANGGVVDIQRNYADGGTIAGGAYLTTAIQQSMWNAIRRAFPGAVLTSGTRTQDVGSGYDFHMAGQAIDLVGPMQQMANWISETYGSSILELFWDPGPNWDDGRPHHAIGGHSDHVHWAMSSIVDPYTGDVVSAEGGSRGFFNPLRSMFNAFIDKLISPIKDKFDSFGGGVGKILPAAGNAILDGAVEWLLDKLPIGGGGGASGIDLTGLSGSNREMGKQAAEQIGWSPHWNSLDSLIMGESGWNNTAQNPTSTAYGIFQFLDSTWASVGGTKTSDPAKQIEYGFRYIQNRYGDPTKAYNFWLSQNPHWYDQGGEASGKGFMAKNVIKPERVLSPNQTEAFNDFVYRFLPEMIRSFKENPSDLRKGFSDVVYAITLGNISLEKMREEQIDNMATALKDVFRSREKGRGGSLREIFGPFGGAGVAGSMLGMAILDPEGYLEAEERAIEMAEEEAAAEEESAKKAAEEERRKQEEAERAREEAERKAAEEARKKEEAEKEAAEAEEDPLSADGEEPVDVKVVEDESDTETDTGTEADTDTDTDTEADTEEPVEVEVEVEDAEDASDEEAPEVEVDTDTSDTVDSDEAVVPSTSSESADTVNIDADTVNVNGATATEDAPVAVEEDSPEEDTEAETTDALPSDLEEATETGDAEEVEPVSTEPVEAVVVDDESEVDPAEAVAEAADVQVAATEEVSEEEKAAIEARKQADEEAARKREQEEQDEIRRRKESGEYYYGFKVLNKDGSNPNEYEASESEKLFRSTLVSLSGPSGFSSLVSKVDDKLSVAQSLASGIMTAMPAWTSAISGVGSAIVSGNFAQLPAAVAGLSHNIAAASASAMAQTSKEALELVPSAVTGVAEMLISSSALNSQQAPFIENVNAGMTQGELMQTLSHYDMMRSRRGGGTPRMRG